jgi:hypothetical protein
MLKISWLFQKILNFPSQNIVLWTAISWNFQFFTSNISSVEGADVLQDIGCWISCTKGQ